MRREIIGILLFFLVIFSLISLLSYSPNDPSVHNVGEVGRIQNLFGVLGAHFAGLLIGLFGLGAFWIPLLLLFASIHFFTGQAKRGMLWIAFGGVLLILTTGGLLAIHQKTYDIFGHPFSAGGIVGLPLEALLLKYSNLTGSLIILALLWLIGFILVTGFSLAAFFKRCWHTSHSVWDRVQTWYIKRKEQRKKARQRSKLKKTKAKEKNRAINIRAPQPAPIKAVPVPKQEVFAFMRTGSEFELPPIGLLDTPPESVAAADNENLRMQSRLLEKKLEDFGVSGKVDTVSPGPVITTFEYEPAPGVKINKIVNLTDDLALALRAESIRIVAPIPGKAVIGIEIPNAVREIVHFKDIVASTPYMKADSKITLCLGKDIVGNPVVAALERMPHLLIAGATGTGKSVALNAMICSILFKAGPEDVKFIMIDPKRIELSNYDGIPHLITPVVTDVKKATNALFWAVKEMERRYELLSKQKSRNIEQYNRKIEKIKPKPDEDPPERLPLVVIVIDELADLMMVASRDVEFALTRLAQMARASGIHLILATQRPSVDVLTGIIKANFPARLTFQVSSKTDSRTIIDTNGAENLLGSGDMLFMPPGTAKLKRIHGAFLSEPELSRIVDHLKLQKPPVYDHEVVETPAGATQADADTEYDDRYDDAVALVTKSGQASISMIQRHLRIGYNRAARIIETMEQEGIVGPSDGAKPREVLVRGYEEMP